MIAKVLHGGRSTQECRSAERVLMVILAYAYGYKTTVQYSAQHNGEVGTISYDANTGNLATKDGQSYVYPATGRVHGVTSAGTKGSFSYDANGNMTTRASYTLKYDQANRMVEDSGGGITATFVYDGDGVRVKGTVGGVTTIYIGEHYEVSGTTVKKYYYSGGARVAERVEGSPIPAENGLYFLLTDHLGSTTLTIKDGVQSGQMKYLAWGESRPGGSLPTSFGYTGQRAEDAVQQVAGSAAPGCLLYTTTFIRRRARRGW